MKGICSPTVNPEPRPPHPQACFPGPSRGSGEGCVNHTPPHMHRPSVWMKPGAATCSVVVQVAEAHRGRAGVWTQAWELPVHTLPGTVKQLAILPRPGVERMLTLQPRACSGHGEAMSFRRKRLTHVERKGRVFQMVAAGVKTWRVGGDEAQVHQQTDSRGLEPGSGGGLGRWKGHGQEM